MQTRRSRIVPAVFAMTSLLWLFLAGTIVQAAEVDAGKGNAGVVVFVAGQATLAGRAATLEQPVRVGDEILTGSDGHIYIRSVDNGYLILRPGSRARIAVWRIDAQDPAATRIKIELMEGVARNITGHAAKAARQNYRFNTPVAAIGVRGTDFTVFTDAHTTRVAVHSGGIIASPFTGACVPEGGGPCTGPASLELLAAQSGLLLQIERDRPQPRLLPINGNAPDHLAPPRREEPGPQAAGAGAGASGLDAQRATGVFATASATPAALPPTAAPPPRQIHWGRWRDLADRPASVDISAVLAAGGELDAISPWFAVLRGPGPEWQKPASGTMSFALTGGEAWVINESTRAMTQAQIENARLQLDFGRSSFTTGFDLVATQRHAFQAQGQVGADGRLYGDSQFATPTNMAVDGVLGANGNAAYLFQGRIDEQHLATGVTAWQSK